MMLGKMMPPKAGTLGAVTKSWVQNHAGFRHDSVIMILSRIGARASQRWQCRRVAGSPQTGWQEDWGQESDTCPASACSSRPSWKARVKRGEVARPVAGRNIPAHAFFRPPALAQAIGRKTAKKAEKAKSPPNHHSAGIIGAARAE